MELLILIAGIYAAIIVSYLTKIIKITKYDFTYSILPFIWGCSWIGVLIIVGIWLYFKINSLKIEDYIIMEHKKAYLLYKNVLGDGLKGIETVIHGVTLSRTKAEQIKRETNCWYKEIDLYE